jgi:hypothetical protein
LRLVLLPIGSGLIVPQLVSSATMLKLAELAVIVGLTMLVNVAVPVLVSVNPNTGANSGFVPRVTVPKLCEDGVRFAPGCVLTPPHCVPADTSTAPTSTQGLAAVFRGLPKKSVGGASA